MVLNLVVVLQVGEVMVEISVAGLVGANIQDHVPEGCIFRHLIVVDGLLGSAHGIPNLKSASVDLIKHDSVSMHSFFFKISYKSVACRWSEQVGQEIAIEEDTLSSRNQYSVEDSWVSEPQEEEQVHSLVLCLLEQMMNPAVVALQCSQTSQVPLHPGNHSWHASNRLQEDYAVHPGALIHIAQVLFIVFRGYVTASAARCNHSTNELSADALRRNVRVTDFFSFLLGVDRVRHAIAFRIHNDLMLDHLVKKTFTVWLHI